MNLKNILFLIITITSCYLGISQANLVANGDFSNYDPNCTNFSFAFTNTTTNCVSDWSVFSGSPSLHGTPNTPQAWMWSAGGTFEAIQTPVTFKQGQCYTVSFDVTTNDRNNPDISLNGTINLRAINSQNGIIQSQQTIYSNSIGGAYLNNWQTITTTFTPTSTFSTLLINPFYDSEKQAEMAITNIVIMESNLSVDFNFEDTTGLANDTFCEGETILLDGTNSTGEANYFIDAWRRPIGNTGSFQYVSGLGWTSGQLGVVDLTSLFSANNINFEQGYEYEIKVALGNGCIGWLPLTKRFTILSDVSLNSNFTITSSCAENGTISLQVNATEPNAYQWWALIETTTSVTTGGTQIGGTQGGITTTFSGLSRNKNYYIKHGVWKDKDTNCYPWRETRKLVPNSVTWSGYTTNFAMSVSSDFNGQASVNLLADSNAVFVYHGWEVYDLNHNVISGYCCNSDSASFQGLAVNTWYYVKHGIWNNCKEWQETRRYFRIQISPSRNNIGGFILESKEYPYELDSSYAKEKEESIVSGLIFKQYEEYKESAEDIYKTISTSEVEIYPNPVQIGEVLTIASSSIETIEKVELVSFSGKNTPISFTKEKENIQIVVDTNLLQGIYFVRIVTTTGETIVQQLAIQ